jgi:hypothetical protein
MSPEFRALVNEHMLAGLDAQIAFAEFQDGRPFQIDLEAGQIMVEGRPPVALAVVGTWAMAPTNSFLWAWANPGWRDLPEPVLRAAHALKSHGDAHGVAELTAAELPAEDDTIGFHSLAIARGLIGAEGGMQYVHGSGSAFFLMPDVPGISDHPTRHIRVITQGLQAYDLHAETAIRAYLSVKGYSFTTGADGETRAQRGPHTLTLRYDAQGRLTDLSGQISPDHPPAPPRPEPTPEPKRSGGLLGRLFKR